MKAPAAVKGGGSLSVAIFADPLTFDPHLAGNLQGRATTQAIHDTLLTVDEDGRLAPNLALSWEWKDGKTIVMKLREGVKFHDGTDFDAEAVRYNIERIRNPDTGSIRGGEIGTLDTVEVGVMALPPLVRALTISAVLGSGLVNATAAIAVVAAPTYTRLVRGQVLSIKHNDCIGAPTRLILWRHVLPNTFNPIIVQASLGVGFAIILESSLSFIGLGAQTPIPSWGNMVQVGFQFLAIAPWFALVPAAAIFVAVLGFNMLGDGLRDVLDPQSHA